MKRFYLIFLLLAILLAAAGGVWAYTQLQTGTSLSVGGAPAPTETYEIEVDGITRKFIAYRPKPLKSTQAVPVVFMYHGHGGTGEKFYKMSGWTEKADKEGLMVIFPTAMRYHMIRDGVPEYATRWNSYQSGKGDLDPAYPDQVLADDVAFTKEMIVFLEERYAIDHQRLYVNGFSNGGNFMNRLLNEMSDTFAAFANSSSGLSAQAVDEAGVYPAPGFTPRPVIALAGSTDPLLTTELGVEAFPTDESVMDNDSIVRERFIDGYLTLLKLSDDYSFAADTKLSKFSFKTTNTGQISEVPFIFMIAPRMDHILPNGKNYPLVAADVYWEVFKQYSL